MLGIMVGGRESSRIIQVGYALGADNNASSFKKIKTALSDRKISMDKG